MHSLRWTWGTQLKPACCISASDLRTETRSTQRSETAGGGREHRWVTRQSYDTPENLEQLQQSKQMTFSQGYTARKKHQEDPGAGRSSGRRFVKCINSEIYILNKTGKSICVDMTFFVQNFNIVWRGLPHVVTFLLTAGALRGAERRRGCGIILEVRVCRREEGWLHIRPPPTLRVFFPPAGCCRVWQRTASRIAGGRDSAGGHRGLKSWELDDNLLLYLYPQPCADWADHFREVIPPVFARLCFSTPKPYFHPHPIRTSIPLQPLPLNSWK